MEQIQEVKPQETNIHIQKLQEKIQENNLNKDRRITYIKERDVLRCLVCNSEVMSETLFSGMLFNRKKTIIYYCPLCDFEKKKEFKLNNKQYKKEVNN